MTREGPAILALRGTSCACKRKGCMYLLVRHRVLRESGGLGVDRLPQAKALGIRGSVPVAWSGRQSLSERFMPTLGTPSTWCGRRQFIPGSLATRFGCWCVVGVSSLRRCRVRPFDNGSWGGIGGAQALVCLFVCCTRCVFGCGGAAGTSAFASPTCCCCKVGFAERVGAKEACCALPILPEGA